MKIKLENDILTNPKDINKANNSHQLNICHINELFKSTLVNED